VLPDREVRLHAPDDFPLLIDQKRHALHPESQRPVDPEHLDDFLGLVGQQREAKPMLLAKPLVRLRGLGADARDGQPRLGQFPVQVADRTGLPRTARREIGRVEVEDDGPVLEQARQGNVVPVLVRERELWCLLADVEHVPDIKRVLLARASADL
jgi:hypothetical protein